jgi:hypothetical protein
VGEETGGISSEGAEAAFAGIGCSGGVSGSSPEFDASSWDPDGGDSGGDSGGESGFASIEAGRDSGVPR